MPRPHFDRYERVYHRRTRRYGNLLAPGPNAETVTVAVGSITGPLYRKDLRRLYWWERLLNR